MALGRRRSGPRARVTQHGAQAKAIAAIDLLSPAETLRSPAKHRQAAPLSSLFLGVGLVGLLWLSLARTRAAAASRVRGSGPKNSHEAWTKNRVKSRPFLHHRSRWHRFRGLLPFRRVRQGWFAHAPKRPAQGAPWQTTGARVAAPFSACEPARFGMNGWRRSFSLAPRHQIVWTKK